MGYETGALWDLCKRPILRNVTNLCYWERLLAFVNYCYHIYRYLVNTSNQIECISILMISTNLDERQDKRDTAVEIDSRLVIYKLYEEQAVLGGGILYWCENVMIPQYGEYQFGLSAMPYVNRSFVTSRLDRIRHRREWNLRLPRNKPDSAHMTYITTRGVYTNAHL